MGWESKEEDVMKPPLGMLVPPQGRDAQRLSQVLRAPHGEKWRVPIAHAPARWCVFRNGIHFEELDHGDQSFS